MSTPDAQEKQYRKELNLALHQASVLGKKFADDISAEEERVLIKNISPILEDIVELKDLLGIYDAS